MPFDRAECATAALDHALECDERERNLALAGRVRTRLAELRLATASAEGA
jgi:hypothetical protein